MPGHAKDSITITVGYGRTRAGRLGNGTGFNAYALRGSTAPCFGAATITRTGDDYDLVGTQDHWAIEGRNIVRSATLEEFKENPAFVKEMEHGVKLDKRISLYADKEYRGQQWGMAIDMNACTGCMACVIACVAENNIPVVGKVQVKTQPRDALAAHRPLLRRQPRHARHLHASRCPASSARTRPAKWSARSRRRCTAPKA